MYIQKQKKNYKNKQAKTTRTKHKPKHSLK